MPAESRAASGRDPLHQQAQGALSRTGNIEVGFDADFENRWGRLQRWVWRVAAVLLVLGLLFLFGRGPLSQAVGRSADGAIEVSFERTARTRTPAAPELVVKGAAASSGQLRVRLHGPLTERARYQQFQPVAMSASGSDLLLTFRTQPGSGTARVSFLQEPLAPGIVDGDIRIEQAGSVRLRQFVLP